MGILEDHQHSAACRQHHDLVDQRLHYLGPALRGIVVEIWISLCGKRQQSGDQHLVMGRRRYG